MFEREPSGNITPSHLRNLMNKYSGIETETTGNRKALNHKEEECKRKGLNPDHRRSHKNLPLCSSTEFVGKGNE